MSIYFKYIYIIIYLHIQYIVNQFTGIRNFCEVTFQILQLVTYSAVARPEY